MPFQRNLRKSVDFTVYSFENIKIRHNFPYAHSKESGGIQVATALYLTLPPMAANAKVPKIDQRAVQNGLSTEPNITV